MVNNHSINWGELGKILDRLEISAKGFANEKLLGAQVEKWRWDNPELNIQWEGEDGLNRNIQILVENDSRGGYYLRLGAAAWLDNVALLQREWTHRDFPAFSIAHPNERNFESSLAWFSYALGVVYRNISTVDKKALNRTDPLQPPPSA